MFSLGRSRTHVLCPPRLFELLLLRATMKPPFDRFGATIMMVFRKPVQNQASMPSVPAEQVLLR